MSKREAVIALLIVSAWESLALEVMECDVETVQEPFEVGNIKPTNNGSRVFSFVTSPNVYTSFIDTFLLLSLFSFYVEKKP